MTGVSKKVLSALGLLAVWLLVWETAFRLSGKEPWQFAPPSEVLSALWAGVADHTFLQALGRSLGRIGCGFGLALLLGTGMGFLLVHSRLCNWLAGPLVLGVQSLPSICWMPVAVLWFGLNERAILFVVLMGSVGSITMATRDGLRQIPVTYQRVASTFGASLTQRLLWVSLPAALPVFISGLKQGWSFAWRSLLAGELLYAVAGREGMGGLLTMARDLADYARMFAAMILIVCVSVLVDRVIFSRLEQHVRVRWGLAAR
ncbi:MAG: ABC transporter permease [Planctomycetota bacterium]|nr:ABC transporter permease [Planctomycetota bacterium]